MLEVLLAAFFIFHFIIATNCVQNYSIPVIFSLALCLSTLRAWRWGEVEGADSKLNSCLKGATTLHI